MGVLRVLSPRGLTITYSKTAVLLIFFPVSVSGTCSLVCALCFPRETSNNLGPSTITTAPIAQARNLHCFLPASPVPLKLKRPCSQPEKAAQSYSIRLGYVTHSIRATFFNKLVDDRCFSRPCSMPLRPYLGAGMSVIVAKLLCSKACTVAKILLS